MSPLPNFAKALLTTSSLFASPGWQAAERERFAAMNMRLETYEKRCSELLDNMRDALSLSPDSDLWKDFKRQLYHFGTTLDAYALHTVTFGADGRQVLWVIGRDVAPALGRTWGFWCLDEPIMPDLPGGNLWFLPHVDPDHSGRLVLPVEVIARWWRGLLAGPIEAIWEEEGDDRHRTFQTWLAGKATPTPRKLEEWYSDDRKFRYRADIPNPPETRVVRTLLLWARALETGWATLVAALTPDVPPDDPDPMRNKALQLVQLFRLAHQLTVTSAANDPVVADQMFRAAVPDWLARGDFRSIVTASSGHPNAPENSAAWLSECFRSLLPGEPLRDIFRDVAMNAPPDLVVKPAILALRLRLESCLNEGNVAWRSDTRNRAAKVKEALAQARANPRSADMEADIQYLAALDALSRGRFDAARKMLDRGRDLSATGSFGRVRLEIALLSLALSVAHEAFDQNRSEADFRVLFRSVPPEKAARWGLGHAPIAHSMRLAAVDTSRQFWEGGFRPYPGAIIEHPLEASSAIFKDYTELLFSDADERKIRAFLGKHKGALKRKLRDVRGDTFFTMTNKIVLDLVAKLRAISPFHAPLSNEAARMHATYLRFVGLLPTDMLSARDYLGQTALMLAANSKDAELVKTLVDRRVDLDAQDTLGRTALHAAVRSDAIDCFKLLLDAGANPTLRTVEGKTPAIFAAEFGRAPIFQHRLAHRLRPVTKEELRLAYTIAARNERDYKKALSSYRECGVELGCRSAFMEIMALANREE